ncbi:hypothetical protein [Mycobacterium attenuatum]|uniref:hypothetical protein n=1 Tax=Mycobacterium attenuatum TaxID=2341086 RepID=UPI000F037549|nr:hypothetical protein [Mycobacterium attenuatum]VBA61223.1 hypothetical protein LAUMK41_04599 [Mycobacterium attenuatum]
MTNTEPEVRRFTIRTTPDANPNAVHQSAVKKAWAAVAGDEEVFDLKLDDVLHPNEYTTRWEFSYQVLKPGDTGTERLR